MLNSQQLQDIQIRTEGLYLKGRHAELLDELRAQAWENPDEELLSYSYAHHALMLDESGTHLTSALALIEQRREVPGDTPDDIWIARLQAATGRVEKGIATLLEAPFYQRDGHVSYAAFAVWLACEHERPELAPLVAEDDLAGQIAQLRLAAIMSDVESGQWHMQHILTGIEQRLVGEPLTVGNVPCPALDVALGEWLDDAYDAWGSKISWLSPSNRKGLISMSERLQRPITCQPGVEEADLIQALESGDHVSACRIYLDMATTAVHKRCPVPKGWRGAKIAPPNDLEGAVQAAEEILLQRELDANVILPWYQAVWSDLIDSLPPRRRAGYHMAVMARTHCAAARMNAARGYAANGQFVKAMRLIQPMRYYADWSEEALALEKQWHRNLVSSQVRLESEG